MITTDKVKEHIALAEEAVVRAQKLPTKAAKKETAKWFGVRNSLLQAVALLGTNPTLEFQERQHAKNVEKLSNYHDAKKNIPRSAKKMIDKLDQECNPNRLKEQLNFLNYLLEKNNDLLCGLLSSASSPA